ncbi:VWA domain-containing protein [Vulgatibacter incomptus]|uniref:Carbon monoxide dehydrogenase E protein n=1 Tax=Vulgatibacter incomptus TaxID=1391653 RepID=A0A0K1PBE9_9BACT|nr:VWA domain-containing protein [Vulgatibacter incomptus]AKU90822.1 carbon monoxide dehydrogenase E protein [Vulgatibacter incomptus]
MEARIVELAELLRQNGIRVSPAEVTDASVALSLTGVSERETVRGALKATLLKRAADHDLFDRLFDLYFSGLQGVLDGLETSILRRIEEEGVLEGDELEMLLYTLRDMGQRLSPLTQAMLDGDAGQMAKLLRGSALQLDFGELASPLQAGFYARRLATGAGTSQARGDLDELADRLKAKGIDPAKVELVGRRLSERLREVEAAARRYVEQEIRARGSKNKQKEGALAGRAFSELSREELDRTQLAVRRLAEKLKSRLVRRQREKRRGALNVQRTLRKNMGLGGVPAQLVFRNRRPQRPDVVVLCDVSDSVRNVSRLMLLFVHTLQARFAKVRSFAFVSDVGEITQHFKEVDASRAVDLAVAGQSINVYANSNYGRAFMLFAGAHLGAVTRRTTVLVIGDGRNNYNAPNVWALKELKRRARRVIWICPEDRPSWGFGDSEMALYEKAVDQVVVVQNLGGLEAAAEQIVSG